MANCVRAALNRPVAAALAVFLSAASPAVVIRAQGSEASKPADSAARPAGRWHYWTHCDRGVLVAHETGGLWFAADELLWRYDLKTGEVRSLSMLDDLSAITGPNALVPGKDCASVAPLVFGGRVFQPGQGWSEIPMFRYQFGAESFRFRPDGTLVYQVYTKPGGPKWVFSYRGGWHSEVLLPYNKDFVPLADGYLLFGTGNTGEGIPLFYDLKGKPKAASPVGGARFSGTTYRVGTKTYVVLLKGWRPEQQILYDATSGQLVKKARGDVVGPDVGPDVFAYDAASQTGWTLEDSGKPPFALRLHRFVGGKRETLVTLPTESASRPDFIRDAQGRWWWIGYDKTSGTGAHTESLRWGVIRLSGTDTHLYPTKPFRSGFAGFLFYGASKRIWLCDAGGWSVWDASADRFVPGEPWEEFAFAFGPWTLSLVADRGDLCPLPAVGQRQEVRSLRRKQGGSWAPMANPFGSDELIGAPGMVRGNRMLASTHRTGVLEYDVTNDRWVRLYPESGYDAFFDAAGRRMLVCDTRILAFDGDPFDGPSGNAAAAQEIADFDKLLQRMDDDKWRVREQATAEMEKIARKHVQWLRAALDHPQTSLEVQWRIRRILRSTGLDKAPLQTPKSLFDQMHRRPEVKSVPLPATPGAAAGD